MRAALYHRISSDRAQDEAGVERQAEDTAALAKARGYEVVASYTDNDISAAGKIKRSRPQYDAMLEAARGGAFDVIVSYSNSRLTRRPRELEDLLDLHDDHGVKFFTVVSGDDDLSTADGQMVARLKVAIDAAEARRAGERVKRQKEQRAAEGKPQGTRYRPFGYNRDWTVNEAEAELVREAFERSLNGQSMVSITNEFIGRGVQTTAGKPWNRGATRRLLAYPIYAGIYVFRGEQAGASSMPAIVDRLTFEAANQQDKIKHPAGHNTRKHLLSGILHCDTCKHPMVMHTQKERKRYRCNVHTGGCGKTTIKAEWVDEVLTAYMMSMRGIETIQAPVHQVDLSVEIEESKSRASTILDAINAGEVDLADGMQLLKAERAKETKLVKEQAKALPQRDYFDGAAEWETLDLSTKRAAIRQRFQYIYVRPGRRGHWKFDEARLWALMADGKKVSGWDFNVVNPLTLTFLGPDGPVDARSRNEDGSTDDEPRRASDATDRP